MTAELVRAETSAPALKQWSDEQIEMATRSFAAGCDHAELEVFAEVAARKGLDPWLGQIVAIKRSGKMIIQETVEGYRAVAERSGLYGGYLGPWWRTKDGPWDEVWLEDGYPAAAKILVIRKDWSEPAAGVAAWKSNVQMFWDRQEKKSKLVPIWDERPDEMLAKCLPGRALIETSEGTIPIGRIVRDQLDVKVRSINLATGLESWERVVGWWHNGSTANWVRIWAPDGIHGGRGVRVTHDHPFWSPTGWVKAGELDAGDLIGAASPVLTGPRNGMAFVPVLRTQAVTRTEPEGRYDIEVENTHTFVYQNLVLSNCAEVRALKRAFSKELAASGIRFRDLTDAQVVTVEGRRAGLDDDARHELIAEVTGGRTDSSTDLTDDETIEVRQEIARHAAEAPAEEPADAEPADEPADEQPAGPGTVRRVFQTGPPGRADEAVFVDTTTGQRLDGAAGEALMREQLMARIYDTTAGLSDTERRLFDTYRTTKLGLDLAAKPKTYTTDQLVTIDDWLDDVMGAPF